MQVQIDLERMRKRLRKRQKVLSDQIISKRSKVKSSRVANPDRVDLADDYAYRARRKFLLEQWEDQLAEINRALKRINEGTYGICENCGNAILVERLEALPYAELCIECQRKVGTS
jgi:DnaK suppressor protein